MYRLADVDFSNRLGIVVSELAPEEMDRQDQTLGAKQGHAKRPCDRILGRQRLRDGGFRRSLSPGVASENHIRTYWWCNPARIGMATMAPAR